MSIGDLVKHKRTNRLFVIFRIADNGNIGCWAPLGLSGKRPLRAGHLIWTYAGALETI